eukprot:TRINITY_DN105207_c0_g1_i1.p1 TRINITY_DN105207_c0_g1~~TRINITY_DN105207_c0_g1_i1.p1  ORF type:complete len:1209 (-),score=141.88 TRINITY_DN105207_c0_g1_i1:640-4266(-)
MTYTSQYQHFVLSTFLEMNSLAAHTVFFLKFHWQTMLEKAVSFFKLHVEMLLFHSYATFNPAPLSKSYAVQNRSPLEKYMTKANAKNWSDFANRIIKKGKYNKKQNRNNKLAVLEKVVFKSNKGAELDICRLKRPLSSKRRSVDASEHVKVELRTSKCSGGPDDSMRAMPKRKKKGGSSKLSLAEAGKYAGKVNIDLEQIELLESIGVLLKFKDTYYPQSMTEVAYFVQQIFGGQLVREEDAVPQDVKDFGLAAYRNNLHLSDREECIVLIDWLKMMKEKFALSEPRNLQLLLSFCMGEAVRMSKIECNERGLLVQLVWKEALNIMKEQQETFQNAKREITHKWMDKNKEFEEALSKKFKEMKSQINDMSELIEKLQKEIRSKDFELERLMKENKELKDRCQALSGILDHLAAKSISDGKKYSKNQKRLILAKLRQLEKDREALQTYFPEKIDTPVNRLEMLKKELEKSVEEELNEEDVKEKEEVNEQIEVANEEEASVKVEEKEVTSTKNTNKKSRVKRKVHLEQKATQTNKTITVEKYVGGSDDEAEVEESEEEEYVTEITEELKPAPILPTVQMPKSVKSSLSPSNRESPKLQTRINTELPKKHAVEQNTEEEESEEELEEEDEELVKPVKSKPKLEEKPAKKVDLAPKKPLAKPKEMKKTSSELKGTSRIKKAPEEKKAPAKETITVAKPQRPSKEPSPLPPKPTPVNKEQFSTQKPIITPITVTMTGPEEPKDISEDTLPLAKPPAPALKNNTNVEPLPRPSIVQPSITPVTESSIKTVIESHIDQISPNLKTLLTQFFSDMLSFQYIEQIYQLILKCCKGIPYEVPILLNKTTVSPSISPKSLSQEPHRALTEPKSNVSRSVSPSEDRPSDTIIIDHEALKLEDPATELPKKLMAAMSHMTDKISHLETDEYGEWLLDITKDSELVERIRKNGHLLTLLLRKLYKKKENKEIGTGYNSDIRIYNNETQTETVFTAETLQKLIGSSEREYAGKIWKDQAIQTAIIPPIKSHSPMPIFSKLHDMGQTTVITKEKDVRYLTTPPSPVSSRELYGFLAINKLNPYQKSKGKGKQTACNSGTAIQFRKVLQHCQHSKNSSWPVVYVCFSGRTVTEGFKVHERGSHPCSYATQTDKHAIWREDQCQFCTYTATSKLYIRLICEQVWTIECGREKTQRNAGISSVAQKQNAQSGGVCQICGDKRGQVYC